MPVALIGFSVMIWALGKRFRWHGALVFGLIALAFVIGLGTELVRDGGEPAPVAILGGVAVLVGGYVYGLRRLKSRAEDKEEAEDASTAPTPLFRAAELERYARHIVLRELGGPGQKKLKQAKVLVVGAGGLGSPALMYLTAAGVGTIGVIDDDEVDHTNLQRQIIHRDEAIGDAKVMSAAQSMTALNPYITVRPYKRRLSEATADALCTEYDLILDGTDNFETRYLVNRVAVAQSKPLISGALAQWEGQLSVFDPAKGGPCYQCVFPEAPAPGLAPSCSEAGVVSPLPGVIGTMMALEAIKLITGAGHVTRGEMLIYDGLYGESRKIKLARRDDCPVCSDL